MVVYLIVKGDYDERVCAVTGNKEKAERLKKLFSSDFPTYVKINGPANKGKKMSREFCEKCSKSAKRRWDMAKR